MYKFLTIVVALLLFVTLFEYSKASQKISVSESSTVGSFEADDLMTPLDYDDDDSFSMIDMNEYENKEHDKKDDDSDEKEKKGKKKGKKKKGGKKKKNSYIALLTKLKKGKKGKRSKLKRRLVRRMATDIVTMKAFLTAKFKNWKKTAKKSKKTKQKLKSFLKVFCFAASTLVDMAYGSKRMDEVKLGEKLSNGAFVTGVMQFMSSEHQLYDYRGVVVTGEHKVLEHGQFVAVRDSKMGQLLNLQLDKLYDLDTSNHRIMIQNITFADYSEVHRLPKVEKIEIKQLNQ